MSEVSFDKLDQKLIATCRRDLTQDQTLFIESTIYQTRKGEVNHDGFLHYHIENKTQAEFINNIRSLRISFESNKSEDFAFGTWNVYEEFVVAGHDIYLKLSSFPDWKDTLNYRWTAELAPTKDIDIFDILAVTPEEKEQIEQKFEDQINRWKREDKWNK